MKKHRKLHKGNKRRNVVIGAPCSQPSQIKEASPCSPYGFPKLWEPVRLVVGQQHVAAVSGAENH